MKILGIETSCDETAVALIEITKNEYPTRHKTSKDYSRIRVLSNIVSSQSKLHAQYGGVVPNLAAREHVKNIGHVFRLALKEAKIKNFSKEVDLIAITRGPGLGPSLLVGLAFAKTLAWKYNKPLIGVNHLEGHIYSNWLKPIRVNYKLFPILNLIVSGGHTELVLMIDYGKYELIGETLDDAVGEAFDKVARLLNLGYPGGPIVSLRATKLKTGDQKLKIKFPRPMIKSNNFNFSYSGLKTSVLYKLRDFKEKNIRLTDNIINEVCYEFQNAAIDVLVQKTIRAAEEYKVKSVFLSGGVSANKLLRQKLQTAAAKKGFNYSQPLMEYTTDNAAMIAMAGYVNYLKKKKADSWSWKSVYMDANLGF